MIATIYPSSIKGIIQAPASKSVMQRACAAALLHKGSAIIRNPGTSNDDLAALRMIEDLGAQVNKLSENEIRISSNGVTPVNNTVNCGESGLGIRMFTPIISLSDQTILIEGEGSLLTRPMNFFDEILPLLGVQVTSKNGKLPLSVHGPLTPNNVTVDGSLSSQFLTGLLLSFSAAKATDVIISVNDLKSKPYIDLTLQVMNQFGLKTPVNKNYASFYFDHSPITEKPFIDFTVEGDWSGGALILVAAAIAGELTIRGLRRDSTQADKKILEALKEAGANLRVFDDYIIISHKYLKPFSFDATDCPDLFPPLVALAAHCNGITVIKGLKRLKHKESDRGLTLKEEFEKLGIGIELNEDVMIVHGKEKITVNNNQLNAHHDHRIAMACAVTCLKADKEVYIHGADSVNKSYPAFYNHLESAGVKLLYNKEVAEIIP